MGSRGPAGKSVVELKLRGTYRADKHKKRESQPVPVGVPVKPKGLDKVASAYWDVLLPQLIDSKMVTRLDTEQCVTACEAWTLYRAAFKAALARPTDKFALQAYRAYFVSWQEAVKQLGLSPLARSRLTVEKPQEEAADPFDAFVRKRG